MNIIHFINLNKLKDTIYPIEIKRKRNNNRNNKIQEFIIKTDINILNYRYLILKIPSKPFSDSSYEEYLFLDNILNIKLITEKTYKINCIAAIISKKRS